MLNKLKEKAVKMTNMRKYLVLGVAMAFAIVTGLAFAQDDLDNLLKDLEAETTKPAEKAEAAAPAATAPSASETPPPQAEAATEGAAVPTASEAKEEPAPAKAEEPAKEEPAPEVKVEEPAKAEAPAAAEKPAEEPVKAEAAAPQQEGAAVPAASEVKEEPAPAAVPANPDSELIENIRTTEKLRREALDVQAKREIAEARKAMKNEEYSEAVRHYGLALKFLNDRPSSKDFRRECDQGVAEGLYRAALQEDNLGRREKAVKLMEKAIDMRHPKARRVLEKWNAEGERSDERTDLSAIKHRLNDEDYKMSRE